MGRVLSELQCPIAPCTTPSPLQYTYDLTGKLTSATNGVASSPGILSTYNFDAAGRLAKVFTTWDDATHPQTLFEADAVTQALTNVAPYGPLGLQSAQLGVSSQSPQQTSMLLSRTYDNRARITSINVLGNQAVPSSPITITISPSAIPSGVSAIATATCSAVCGTGNLMLFIDNNEVGGGGYSPGVANSYAVSPSLALGAHSLYIIYGGDSTHPSVTSNVVPFTVIANTLPATTLTAQVIPSAVPVGESGEIDFTLTCNSSCSSPPFGDGYFLVDGNWGGGLTFDQNGAASNQTSTNLAVGNHTFNAYYYGNGQYAEANYPGTFTVVQQNLPQLNMTVTVTPPTLPQGEYGEVDIASNCTTSCGGGHLFVDGNYAGGFNLDANGGSDFEFLLASPTTPGWSFMTSGQHQLSVVYDGNTSFAPTTGGASFNVVDNNLPIPIITPSVTTYPISSGQPSFVTIVASCTTSCGPSAPHIGSGHVTVDGNYAGGYTFDGTGSQVAYLSGLAAGSHSVLVEYWGNTSYQPANSSPVTFTLTQ